LAYFHYSDHTLLQVSYATIHPCKHASLMKRFVDRLAAENKTLGPRQSARLPRRQALGHPLGKPHGRCYRACATAHRLAHARTRDRTPNSRKKTSPLPPVSHVPPPPRYFFQFLKFMSAVIPTIEYGYTIEMESL